MGRRNNTHKHIPFSQKRIDRIIRNNPSRVNEEPVSDIELNLDIPEEDLVVEEPKAPEVLVLSRRDEYDTLHPIDEISNFLHFCFEVPRSYEYLCAKEKELNDDTQDMLHFAELSKDMPPSKAYKVYRRIREIRRERRKVKNEKELLEGVYNWIEANKDFINRLTDLQGRTSKVKEVIDGRCWSPRGEIDI